MATSMQMDGENGFRTDNADNSHRSTHWLGNENLSERQSTLASTCSPVFATATEISKVNSVVLDGRWLTGQCTEMALEMIIQPTTQGRTMLRSMSGWKRTLHFFKPEALTHEGYIGVPCEE
uniref:Uncharacterized protein n=1 Tax=Picocystis salinarum TaxID=88271 RepID=A0A7S3UAF9_9CHLO|mmetsp:Transcript_10919/g.67463  ORF Transcript_10919/g.67463 Transcript_10919/m.67463 type:complete len:121 (+) Transcript_10919:407-769(+)|eukprot:CAMPEP_0113929312 /NCGR_PEP_ID=MMETSP1159-20121227/5288_1 /TAXON_ID=88271 /ORGANISM="Picocystis salinarum" /LENGTH=120 /DNA_ID=CAMNT_0000929897 /DNA_START=281 /DNA_END=643 /DNA_ORIENTATION=- /assembly_acc=CAM_ASM_000767